MSKKVNKQIFLENLPRIKNNKNKGNIDWNKSIGEIVHFIYDDVIGYVKIIDYIKNGQKLKIEYNNKENFITTGSFIKCGLGKIIGMRTSEFIYKNKTIINNLYILDNFKKENIKYYKYKCIKDNYIGEISEYNLKKGHGCPVCSGRDCMLGINTIWDTDKWMIPYVGEENSKKYSCKSNKKIFPKCPKCNNMRHKSMRISEIYRYNGFKCCFCDDGISYPEKLMFNLLEQLKINFITQYSKSNTKWCEKYKYDFYFKYDDEEYIIETHGMQHYENHSSFKQTLQEVQENDTYKKELALYNGIKEENYIIIDCRYSKLEYIKNNILHSRLNKIFDLSKIDWVKIGQDSEKSLVKEVCEIKNKNNNLTAFEIGKLVGKTQQTIIKWLKKGNELGWCNYNPKEEILKNINKAKEKAKCHYKPTQILKDGIVLGTFKSMVELEQKSEELFGVKLNSKSISTVCRGKGKTYKGFTFRYAI